MTSAPAKFIATLILALLMSACAVQPPTPMALERWQEITRMQLLFKGDDATIWPAPLEVHQTFRNEAALRKTVNEFETAQPNEKLGDQIERIQNINKRSAHNSPPIAALAGLGGIHGHAFLNAAPMALKNKEFDNNHQVVVSISGQITHYEFTPSTSDPDKGWGKLDVVTYITTAKVPNGPGNVQSSTETFRWSVEVPPDKFEVRGIGADPINNPFPNTMDYSPEMKARINDREYKYKLWATGTDIQINKIEKKAGNSSQWRDLRNDPKYKWLYKSTPEDCIDMMFLGRPPRTLNSGEEPPFYCLGRCEKPLIVNTGD